MLRHHPVHGTSTAHNLFATSESQEQCHFESCCQTGCHAPAAVLRAEMYASKRLHFTTCCYYTSGDAGRINCRNSRGGFTTCC